MSNKTLVSSIMIFLDAEKFIQEAIESIFAQTYNNWELLLVDDGSTDGSTEVALRYAREHPEKVRYLEHDDHQNRGMSASRNLGISNAKGEFIAFLDADDVWMPHKLEQQVAILSTQPKAAMLYGRTQLWYSWSGKPEDIKRDQVTELPVRPDTLVESPTLLAHFLQDPNIYFPCTCSVLVRREVIAAVGGFEENFRDAYEDMAFYAKVSLKAPVFVAGGCWDRYRIHSDSFWTRAREAGYHHLTNPNPARQTYLNWLETYLSEQQLKYGKVWEVLQKELIQYRYPTASVEIMDVALSDLDCKQLWGRYVDAPKPGELTGSHVVHIIGWVLGKSSPAVAVEVVSEGTVVRRLPLNARRPDIAQAFPEVPDAEESGFKATISALGTEAELELRLQAVLKDQSRVPLGVIRGRRRWAQREEERVGMALVSVVIPCYNQARFLGEAIESVLSQSYPHFEIVVVDDGSTDNTSEVASRYPGVRCVRQENRGLAGARNAGIRRSKGSYLVFLDADDRLLPNALEVGLKELKAHPECAFVSGHCRFIAADGSTLETPPRPVVEGNHYEALLRTCYIWMPAAVMYQRTVLEYIGGFDPQVSSSADYDVYLRIARDYPVQQHSEVVAEYRRHGSNMTRHPALMLSSEVTVLRRQRKHVGRKKQYREAYKFGIKHSQDYFGKALVEESRTCMQKQQWHQAIRNLSVLMRYHPRGFASALGSNLFWIED